MNESKKKLVLKLLLQAKKNDYQSIDSFKKHELLLVKFAHEIIKDFSRAEQIDVPLPDLRFWPLKKLLQLNNDLLELVIVRTEAYKLRASLRDDEKYLDFMGGYLPKADEAIDPFILSYHLAQIDDRISNLLKMQNGELAKHDKNLQQFPKLQHSLETLTPTIMSLKENEYGETSRYLKILTCIVHVKAIEMMLTKENINLVEQKGLYIQKEKLLETAYHLADLVAQPQKSGDSYTSYFHVAPDLFFKSGFRSYDELKVSLVQKVDGKTASRWI
jgi:hypothetical protein